MTEEINNQIQLSQSPYSQLECHFKWFNELNNKYHGQWLSRLLQKQLHNDLRNKVAVEAPDGVDEMPLEEDNLEHFEDENLENTLHLHSHRMSVLSWRFTLVLRKTFERNYAEALEIEKELLDLEEAKNTSQPQLHIDTYAYVVLVNQLNILEQYRSSSKCPVDENEIEEIVSRMEPLIISVETNEGRAFIAVMKSNLSRDTGYQELRIDFAKEATELNPPYPDWHQCLYLALRQLRRSIDFRQPSSQEEIEACERACELESVPSVGNCVVV